MAEREGIRFVMAKNLFPSFTRGKKRCVRQGDKNGPRVEFDAPVVQLIPPADKSWRKAHVFLVTLSPEYRAKWNKQPGRYYVVASSWSAVESYLQKRYVRIASKFMGAAQYAFKLAQEALSTKSVSAQQRLGAKARHTALGNLRVFSFGGENSWTVRVEDKLAYAAKAFKRSDAVDYAMAKAANSIAGMLRKRAKDILDPSLETPFPEISRHRRSA